MQAMLGLFIFESGIHEMKMKTWGYLAAFSLPLLVVMSAQRGWQWFVAPAFVFVGIPLLDLLFGQDDSNVSEVDYKKVKTFWAFTLIPRVYALGQFAFLIWAVHMSATMDMTTWLTFALAVGLVTGAVGINLAHELGHKTNRTDQRLSQFLLFQVNYMHFFIEHNKGHHAHVATPSDPASSRLGESVYHFLPRTLIGSWRSAWQIESKRLKRSGKSQWGTHNAMLWYAVLPQLLALMLGFVFGPRAVMFFYLQSLIAVLLLEVINYVEHYGLSRRRLEDGSYEKVTPKHSWNATPLISGLFLFQLQRHADHHANPLRPYQTLRHMPDSPQLPAGYATMVPIALLPPLWRRIMNPRVKKYGP